MNRTPSQRMVPLQHRADQREDEAARRLLQKQQAVTQAESKLAELQNYLRDYQRGSVAASTPTQLVNRQAFLLKLSEAERYQQQAVAQAQAACEYERRQWMERRRDQQTLHKLGEVYVGREQRVAERRAQKVTDEFALRQHLNRAPETQD